MLDSCRVQFLLSGFEVNGRRHAAVRVLAFWFVNHLDVVKHVAPCGIARGLCLPPDPLAFQQLEEAFGIGVIVAVPATAHAGIQIVLAEERSPLAAGELRALIGMDHQATLRLAPPDDHEKGLQGKIGGHPRLH